MDEFTPGPWIDDVPYVQAGETKTVAEVLGDRMSNEVWANTRLIAAAPDMFAALEMFADPKRWRYDHTWRFYGENPYELAQAALAKARGTAVDA